MSSFSYIALWVFCRHVVEGCDKFPITCQDCLDFMSKLIWSSIIFSFVKCYTVLSPFAFNLQGSVLFSILVRFSAIHFSTGKYLQPFNIYLPLHTQLQTSRAGKCSSRGDRKCAGSTLPMPDQHGKTSQAWICHHVTPVLLAPHQPQQSAAWL